MPLSLDAPPSPTSRRAFAAFLADQTRDRGPRSTRRWLDDILAEVRERGATPRSSIYTERFDRHAPHAGDSEDHRSSGDRRRPRPRCPPEVGARGAGMRLLGASTDYHRRQAPEDLDYHRLCRGAPGPPLDGTVASAGLYVPGGTAAYPSSVLMNALPAKVAGVERLVMVVPTPDGADRPRWCWPQRHFAGVDRDLTASAAPRRSAALAYGTETIRPVDKIVGPGNTPMWRPPSARSSAPSASIPDRRPLGDPGGGGSRLNEPTWIAADLLGPGRARHRGPGHPDHRRRRDFAAGGRARGRRSTWQALRA